MPMICRCHITEIVSKHVKAKSVLFCLAACLHVDKRNSLFVATSPNLLTAPVSILDRNRNCIKRVNATHCYTKQV